MLVFSALTRQRADVVTAKQAIVAAIAAVLARWKIYDGADARRTALAQAIADQEQTFSEKELRTLFERAERTPRVRSPIGLVISWLERGVWMDHLRPAADARTAPESSSWSPPAEWAEEARLHRLLCVALDDRKPVTQVASCFGLSVEQVRSLVDEHARPIWGDRAVDLWLGKLPSPSFPRRSSHGR